MAAGPLTSLEDAPLLHFCPVALLAIRFEDHACHFARGVLQYGELYIGNVHEERNV